MKRRKILTESHARTVEEQSEQPRQFTGTGATVESIDSVDRSRKLWTSLTFDECRRRR
jgi:hypothetical protein